ncbi:thioredoxin [Parasporobacterium paucivorans]|uniref:Thioredoxin n=1 Tax=Parasporobacterium paucivorans DSM 15970 TaxID=1122934 RepID=A0A1M6D475_9FIRM|nr:thioredoxin [Parasporobacterium paucivorans]SHI68046.1 thioredoxin [Parasporobacterium paucivorans DSM 15970]
MKPVVVTTSSFKSEVLESSVPVLVDFWAAWCGPCKMIGPILDEIAVQYSNIKIAKVNVDEEPELARQFKVMSIPTLIAFKDGKAVSTAVGVRPKAELEKMLGL